MADQPEHVRKQLEEDRAVREHSFAIYQQRMKGRPTPTQEENDRAKLGEHVMEKEDDGSGPDLYENENAAARRGGLSSRQMKPAAGQQQGYQTRGAPPPKPTS